MFTHTLFKYMEVPLLLSFILIIWKYDTTKWNHICHSSFELEKINYTFVFNENMIISCLNDLCNIEHLNYTNEITYKVLDNDNYNILKKNTICFDDNYLKIPYCIVLTTLIGLMLIR